MHVTAEWLFSGVAYCFLWTSKQPRGTFLGDDFGQKMSNSCGNGKFGKNDFLGQKVFALEGQKFVGQFF